MSGEVTWTLSLECGEDAPHACAPELISRAPEYKFQTLPTTNMNGLGPHRGNVQRGAEDVYLYRLADVYVGTHGVIYDRYGRIFLPHLAPFITRDTKDFRRHGHALNRYGITAKSKSDVTMSGTPYKETRVIETPVFLASSYWENAYTHFFLELLPSILIYNKSFRDKARLLISDRVAKDRSEFFSRLGLENGIETKGAQEIVFVRELWVTDFPRFCGPENAGRLQEAFSPHFDPAVRNTGAPVYIARHDAFSWDRNVLNESEILEDKDKYGIEVFVPSDFSLGEQLDKLWRSKLVIGQYGGAMFNLLLGMREKKSFLLCSENYNRFDYDGLAECFGHVSEKLLCRSFESRRDRNNSPIFVNPAPFRTIVDRLVAA